ncbi:MAG: fibronectin type III domain-containing protein [Planctomycetes bacterium]|nr:fibronectin type III domain-containing protein [Planctomycetota bacterium]
MGKVKLELRKLHILDKIRLANTIVTMMTGNPNFTTPVPALADLTNETIASGAAYNDAMIKRQDSKLATQVLDDREDALDLKLTQIALYVENVSAGNETKISSAGMSVRDRATPIGELMPPSALSAMAGNKDGEIDLNWEPVRGANSYVIQMTSDPNVPSSWANKANATESYAVILGLTSGNKYWFRVAGLGAAGQGPFSGAESKYAP